jgi:L-amino acid N-acyltransferase YncA
MRIIRELKPEDIEPVEGIFNLYWTGDFRENLSKRLRQFVASDPEIAERDFHWYVAEGNDEVVGVAALRKLPEHMREYAKTVNPAELYISAVRRKGKGIGEALRIKRIEEAKRLGYTELLLYSGETHQDSWGFHDRFGFERAGTSIAPNGEVGQIWQKILI